MTRRGWLLMAVLGVLWGLPYLLIKVDVDTFSVFAIAGLVIGFPFVLLGSYLATRHAAAPERAHG